MHHYRHHHNIVDHRPQARDPVVQETRGLQTYALRSEDLTNSTTAHDKCASIHRHHHQDDFFVLKAYPVSLVLISIGQSSGHEVDRNLQIDAWPNPSAGRNRQA